MLPVSPRRRRFEAARKEVAYGRPFASGRTRVKDSRASHLLRHSESTGPLLAGVCRSHTEQEEAYEALFRRLFAILLKIQTFEQSLLYPSGVGSRAEESGVNQAERGGVLSGADLGRDYTLLFLCSPVWRTKAPTQSDASIRFSSCRFTPDADIDQTARLVSRTLASLATTRPA